MSVASDPSSVVVSRDRGTKEPLAVIGIGCRFPGGIDSAQAFWEALLRGVDAIREVPADRWRHHRFHDTNPEKMGVIRNAKGGFIDGVDLFDGEFFGYFPAEAQRIDPQQRLLLEVTHEAMEDAGLRRDQLDGSRTAVFVGSFMYDYLCLQSSSEQRDEINPYVAMGTSLASLSNRISYDFNLKGPSVTVDTACSSSLVALHLACKSVWGGEADMAIAAGVNVMLRPEASIVLSKGGFLCPDSHCKAFDASANGYVRSEGVGVVVLKPLHQALADGDDIYATVRATGVNQDGYLIEGYTVPNPLSQISLLEAVYADAGVDPLTVDYLEAHGTGTPVGDPVESLSLGAVLGRDRPEGSRCLLGSVKTNLGHLEGAAGIAGFIKGVLTARHGIVPANLHFQNPNPEIDWENIRLEVPTSPTPIVTDGRARLVGVNSFGAGGTNAHAVVEEFNAARPDRLGDSIELSSAPHRPTLYVVSAMNRETLSRLAALHADHLEQLPHEWRDLAYSAFKRRSHYPHLLAVVGSDWREIVSGLRNFALGLLDARNVAAHVAHLRRPKLAFVYSGQGGQWAKMGLGLLETEPVFRAWMERIDELFIPLAGWSLLTELRKSAEESRIDDTVVVQPAVMAIQIALTKLYEHYGILPSGVVGHSIGEVAAAYVAGALSLEETVRVIYVRSQAQSLAAGRGGMLAVGLSGEDARRWIAPWNDRVSLGAVNGPEMCTLSGDRDALEAIAQELEANGIFQRSVRVQVAYHSHHMDAIEPIMMRELANVQGRPTTLPLYSTVTGHCEEGPHLTAEYWFLNARRPVLFTAALQTMLDSHFDTFVEIGPHPVLTSGAEALFKKLETNAMIAPAMTRRDPEPTVFLHSIARITARGFGADANKLYGRERRFVRLPRYPWQHQRHWYESPEVAAWRLGRFEHPYLRRDTQLASEEGLAVWEASLDVQKFPELRDHQVDGETVFPATGHLELAWAVGHEQFRQAPFTLENLHFDSPLILPDDRPRPLEVRLEIVSSEGTYRICSRPASTANGGAWTRHSSGRFVVTATPDVDDSVSLEKLRQDFLDGETLPVEPFYERLLAAGMAYGPAFRRVQELRYRDGAWLARLEIPEDMAPNAMRFGFFPALLDASLHVIFADVHRRGDYDRVYLPHRIDRVRHVRRPSTTEVWAHVEITRNDATYLGSNTRVYDANGQLLIEVLGLLGKRLVGAGAHEVDEAYQGCYEYRWQAAPLTAGVHVPATDYVRAIVLVGERTLSDEDPFTAATLAALEQRGLRTQLVRFPVANEFNDDWLPDPLDRRTLLIFLTNTFAGADQTWQSIACCQHVPAFLQLAQTLVRKQGVPRLCVVTQGATSVAADEPINLAQAVVHGMARVVRNECPQITLSVVDLSPAESTHDWVENLLNELAHTRMDQDETEAAWRKGSRYLRRFCPLDRGSAESQATRLVPGAGGEYRATLKQIGSLETIEFRQPAVESLGEFNVEIDVQACGLSFRDIINAMGMLPAEAAVGGLTAQRLGFDVAGKVVRVGSRVSTLRPGDAVMARVPEGFRGRVHVAEAHVVRQPAHLTSAQAASIPLAFVTAWYAFHELSHLEAGETVLIHSGAGGVGGAAVQLAQRCGARVLATAGTRDKREHLRRLGVEHVFDSRSLSFVDEVLAATDGRGVDVVLNSLNGRLLDEGLRCVAPFGRFVELGRSDVYHNHKLSLERLANNVSYFVVDVDRLAVQRPAVHRRCLERVAELFATGELSPLPVTTFPITSLRDAMKHLTRAAYVGKIVLTTEAEQVETKPALEASFRADRRYLISGGASGFGLELANWMSERGARHLVLLSRSGPKTRDDQKTIARLQARGISVELVQVDVADAAQIHSVIVRLMRDGPALAGIIHGAAVMDDASLLAMNDSRFRYVFQPKAQGAWNLHAATVAAGTSLDFFVMLSSISSALGFVGQVNYAAANYFQDALAEYRRSQGLRATAVNLGVLGRFAGLSRAVSENQDVLGLLESQGLLVMSLADILAKVEAALVQRPAQRVTGRFDWTKFRRAYPHLARDSRFVDLLSDESLARGSRVRNATLRAELSQMSVDAQRERVEQELATKLGRILDVTPEKLDRTVSIDRFGLDSLMLTDLQIWIGRTLDITLPLIKLLKGPSISALAADLISHFGTDGGTQQGTLSTSQSRFNLTDLEGVRVIDPWLIRGVGEAASRRLVCFHSMGVGASLFTKYLTNPPSGFEVLAIQTPGRENRGAEPPASSVDEIVNQVVPRLLPLFDRPMTFWGHSFGGIVAWEVLRALRERHGVQAEHLMISGTMAPQLIHVWQNREGIAKAMVAENNPEYLISLARYVDDPEFLKSILPLMRFDWPLMKGYRYQATRPLECPITAFAARQDDMVYSDEVGEWRQQTSREFRLIEVDGDHWFLNRNHALIVKALDGFASGYSRITLDGNTHQGT